MSFTPTPKPSRKTISETRDRIQQLERQQQDALSTLHHFRSNSDPALTTYCGTIQSRLNELYWMLGDKQNSHD